MEICAACENLIGQPAEIRPHDGLRLIHVEGDLYRDEEDWSCNECKARFYRFSKGAMPSNLNLGVWKIVGTRHNYR